MTINQVPGENLESGLGFATCWLCGLRQLRDPSEPWSAHLEVKRMSVEALQCPRTNSRVRRPGPLPPDSHRLEVGLRIAPTPALPSPGCAAPRPFQGMRGRKQGPARVCPPEPGDQQTPGQPGGRGLMQKKHSECQRARLHGQGAGTKGLPAPQKLTSVSPCRTSLPLRAGGWGSGHPA